VAFMKYSLKYYDGEINVPALDAVKILSTPLLTASCLMLASSVYAVVSLFRRSLRYVRLAYEMLLGSTLATVATAPLLFNLLRIVELEVNGLKVSNMFESSAGFAYFGSAAFTANTWILALFKPLYTYTLLVAELALTPLLGRELHII